MYIESTSQKSALSKPLIACGTPRISSTLKTCDMSDIWVDWVFHNSFCLQTPNTMDFKDNYPMLESWSCWKIKNTKCIIHHPKPEIYGYQSSSNNMNSEWGILAVSSQLSTGQAGNWQKKLYPENLVDPVKIKKEQYWTQAAHDSNIG